MKLLYCIDCHSIHNITEMTKICNCGHCYGKRKSNSNSVIVYGPCKVYATPNGVFETNKGNLWRLKNDHPEVEVTTDLEKLFST